MRSFNVSGFRVEVDRQPDNCPMCNVYQIPTYAFGMWSNEEDEDLVLVFHCNNSECKEVFLAYYTGGHFLAGTAPKTYYQPVLDNDIRAVSPSFIEIYNQSAQAESLGLKEICGTGYRKSLEFLIKDYLIHNNPEQEADIKSKPLMQCINSITDVNIKFAAQRATWIGNDETHYVRKWEERDVEDLKTLITLAMNFIKNELIMERFREEMASGR